MTPKLGMGPIRRNQVMQAAKHCILKQGIAHFTIKDVSKQANISTGVIYHYFTNKQQLLVYVLKEAFQESEESVRTAVASEQGYEAKFSEYLKAVSRVPEENPEFYLVLLNYMAQAPYNEDVKEIINRFLSNLEQFIEEILAEGISSGKLNPQRVPVLAHLILSQAMGIAFQQVVVPPANQRQIQEEFVRMFQKQLDSSSGFSL
ncbi:TetR/AcrR family transcriptional regulator [Salsuginibacillus kocurii]|uniref:TetR/AcrR family transcriptional regulator n=1 Tax=Salsuginibacillus kocurii TaxID=427078 RepID=UPI00035F0A4E|nr:TetR/AcrR family transcriptional regulator [Salsuginibacillus kocurii]